MSISQISFLTGVPEHGVKKLFQIVQQMLSYLSLPVTYQKGQKHRGSLGVETGLSPRRFLTLDTYPPKGEFLLSHTEEGPNPIA